MKLISQIVPMIASAFLVAGLSACAVAPAKSDDHAHATMGAMDMKAHCEMHNKMMSGKSASEQKAMMQEHMKAMSPETRQGMQAAHEQCK